MATARPERLVPPEAIELGVSDFIALINQTFEFAFPHITITGELANLRVSKGKWLYFDLKDELSTLKCFGTVYQLPGPLEDGMLLKVSGQPRLHNLYGFSFNVQSIQPAGEGSIRRAADLLQAKLAAEGIFDESRKRRLPYPPQRIGLITSAQSAAYADFTKILQARWAGLEIQLIDVQVQGEVAPAQIVAALEQLNAQAEPPEVIIIIRGGGSAEDLAAFSSEQVTRAVAASRAPTLVAIGHEIDLSLAELAADMRASTPSNAAELLTPDKQHEAARLQQQRQQLDRALSQLVSDRRSLLTQQHERLQQLIELQFSDARQQLSQHRQLLNVLNPEAVLRRGYAVVRQQGKVLRSASQTSAGAIVDIQFADGQLAAQVTERKRRGSEKAI